MKKITTLLISIFLVSTFYAQGKFTISGTIKDIKNGESIIGATIGVVEIPGVGSRSNEYGFYSVTLPEGSYNLKVRYLGYKEEMKIINLNSNMKLDIELERKPSIREVKVTAKKKNDNVTTTQMGTETIDIKEIAKVPVIFGEKDVLKTLQLLPGVKSSGEGNSGFNVRGGASDQNLVLLDEANVYNASHLLGFFSTFNSDAIKDATIIKGNSPANYGGRLASVLDVRMKEGNNKKFAVSGGIGLISSRLTVEGPIQKDKSSFIISGRRTYLDVFLNLSDQFKNNTLYFYDLNLKANYKLNDKNKIYVSGYFGRDVLQLGPRAGIDWGNTTGTIRWNSMVNSKLFSNTSFIYSDYDYIINFETNNKVKYKIKSNITDINLKQDFQYYLNPKNTLKFGINLMHHNLTPTRFEGNGALSNDINRKSVEGAAYISNNMKLSEKLTIDYGLRLSTYSLLGGKNPYNIYTNNIKTDSVNLSDGSFGRTYINPEPRFTANYLINDSSSFKIGYSRNTQNLHLLANSTSTSPTDQWIGNSYNIRPEIADQFSIGYARNFNENTYELNVESYYKIMQNQIDYKNSADVNGAPDVESELVFGQGRAYGVEVTLKKKLGKLTGWVGYTLSRTERQIDGVNNNEWYAARQDRTHDLSIVGIYQLTERWSVSALFVYNTGNAVTFPSGKYFVGGATALYYTERNGYRMPANHRLDISATLEGKPNKKFQSSWNFGLYNVYGQENAFLIEFRDDPNNSNRSIANQVSLFRWVPSVTYNFKF